MEILSFTVEHFKVRRYGYNSAVITPIALAEDLSRAISALTESAHKDRGNLDAAVRYAVCVLGQIQKRLSK